MYPSCRSARLKGFDARRTARFVLAAVVFARVPSELPTPGGRPAAPCGAASLRVVRLLVVNEARVAPEALDAAAGEAGAIWAEAGVRLEWTFSAAVVRALGRRHRHRGDSPRAADAAGVRQDRAVREPCPGSGQLRPRRAARQHDRGLFRCDHRARAGRLAVRPANPDAAPREPAGHGRPRSRTRGRPRTGALVRRTRARASRRHEGRVRHPRPRRINHAAAAARLEGAVRKGGIVAARLRASARPRRHGRQEGPMPPHTGGTGR